MRVPVFGCCLRAHVLRFARILPLTALFFATASLPVSAQNDFDQLLNQAAAYTPGQSCDAFRQLEGLLRQSISQPHIRRELEAALIKLLAPTSTFEAQRFACQQLAIIGSNQALPALAELLQFDKTTGIACLALAAYPPGRADELLRRALPTASGIRRLQILNTLGDRRDRKSVPLLITAAQDTDLSLAEAAIAALSKVGDPAAQKAILTLGRSGRPGLDTALTEAALRCASGMASAGDRKAAIAAYEDLLEPPQPPYVRRTALAALIRLDSDAGRKRILSALQGADAALKGVAIAGVRSLPGKDVSETFAAELPALTPEEQVWLIEGLGARGDPASRRAVSASLSSPHSDVRRAAAGVLGTVGDRSSVPLLVRTLADATEVDERRAIETALMSLPTDAGTDEALLREMQSVGGRTRAELISVAVRRQGAAANPMLLVEAANPDTAAAKAAWRALARTATMDEVSWLLSDLGKVRDSEVRTEAVNATAQVIARIPEPSRRSAIVREALARAETGETRVALLGLLPECADALALGELTKRINSPDSSIQEAAACALAEWPDSAAWDALAAFWGQTTNVNLRATSLRGLVRIAGEINVRPDAKQVARYQQLFAGAHTDAERKLMLGSLAGLAHPRALPLAESQLSNPAVRTEAEVAIRKIVEAIKTRYPRIALETLQKLESKP